MATNWEFRANVSARCVTVVGRDDDAQNTNFVLEPDEARMFAAMLVRNAAKAEAEYFTQRPDVTDPSAGIGTPREATSSPQGPVF